MLRRTLIAVIAAGGVGALAASLAGCGSNAASSQPSLGTIDEGRGAIHGVRIGAEKPTVRRAFGSYGRKPEAYPIEPLEIDEARGSGGPWSVVTGPHHLGPGGIEGEQVTLQYRGASFFVRHNRVFGFMVTAPRTPTQKGIAVGDTLDRVRDAYPRFDCEGAFRSDTSATQEPACFGQAPHGRFVYFGGDPIQSITVTERPVDAYAY